MATAIHVLGVTGCVPVVTFGSFHKEVVNVQCVIPLSMNTQEEKRYINVLLLCKGILYVNL